MDEKKIWASLKQSGETLAVPDGLLPEKIEERLRAEKKRRGETHRRIRSILAAAACVVLCGAGLFLAASLAGDRNRGSDSSAPEMAGANENFAAAPEKSGTAAAPESTGEDMEPGTESGSLPSEGIAAAEGNSGTFRMAESYGELYDLLEKGTDTEEGYRQTAAAEGFTYALTEIALTRPEGSRADLLGREGLKEWFPQVNGGPVPLEDCLLLWDGGPEVYLLTVSGEQDSNTFTDVKLIFAGGTEVSLEGQEAVFRCVLGENAGKIAKLSINAGKISYAGE